jgi:hypothetical protein
MAGELVPLVMFPRFSCFSGTGASPDFYTMPVDVTPYESVILSVWRSYLVGTIPTYALTFQESMDQVSWSTVTGVSAGVDPGDVTEVQYTGTLKKRWFRLKLVLGGTGPVVTTWAVGFLERRQP